MAETVTLYIVQYGGYERPTLWRAQAVAGLRAYEVIPPLERLFGDRTFTYYRRLSTLNLGHIIFHTAAEAIEHLISDIEGRLVGLSNLTDEAQDHRAKLIELLAEITKGDIDGDRDETDPD